MMFSPAFALQILPIGNVRACFEALRPMVFDLKQFLLAGFLQLGTALAAPIPAITPDTFANIVARRRMNKGAAAFTADACVSVAVS